MKRSSRDIGHSPEILALVAKLDEQAEARHEEHERKRMLLEAELEEKRREKERMHEERITSMFLTCMQQMLGVHSARPPVNPYGIPSGHSDTPYPYYSSFPNTSQD